jgi:hypothetical protein
MTASARLTVGTAAIDIYQYVELVLAGSYHQRLADHYGVFALGKVLVQFPPVDLDFAASIPDIHPRNGGFPPARTNSKILNHLCTSYISIAWGA